MTYRKLADLRSDLAGRLHFNKAQAGDSAISGLITSFLQSSHELLYWEHDWAELTIWKDVTLSADAYLIDYPTEFDANHRINQVAVNIGTSGAPNWIEVVQGIRLQDYNTLENKTYPIRYQLKAQIEVSPKADKAYTLGVRLFGVRDPDAFVEDDDRPSINDRLLFFLALAGLKAHYKHADAVTVADQFKQMYNTIKSKRGWTRSVWSKREYNPLLDDPYDGHVPLVKV